MRILKILIKFLDSANNNDLLYKLNSYKNISPTMQVRLISVTSKISCSRKCSILKNLPQFLIKICDDLVMKTSLGRFTDAGPVLGEVPS